MPVLGCSTLFSYSRCFKFDSSPVCHILSKAVELSKIISRTVFYFPGSESLAQQWHNTRKIHMRGMRLQSFAHGLLGLFQEFL